jgi:spore cortex formation protein SpoVR/YcgB (stage V sporulation)
MLTWPEQQPGRQRQQQEQPGRQRQQQEQPGRQRQQQEQQEQEQQQELQQQEQEQEQQLLLFCRKRSRTGPAGRRAGRNVSFIVSFIKTGF